MWDHVLSQLPSVLIAQSQAPSGAAVPMGILAVAAIAVAAWAFAQLKRARQHGAQLSQKCSELEQERRELREKERKAQKSLDERRDELKSLKKDLATLRKKHHEANESLARAKEQVKAAVAERDAAIAKRPVFETPTVETQPTPAPARRERKPEKDEKEIDRTPVVPDRTVQNLKAKNKELAEKLEEEREAHKRVRAQIAQMRRRTEGFRRADIITKSKMEILHDKLTGLGRRYYDAISEIAALKGEVALPQNKVIEGFEPDLEFRSLYDDDAGQEEQPPAPAGKQDTAPRSSAN